jgi:hypothetical protein
MIRVLDPVARAIVTQTALAPRPRSLAGLRLGVLSNSKPNAANLMRLAQQRMEQRFAISDVMFFDNVEHGVMAGDAAPDWMLEQLATCDAVLHGGGD